MPVVSRCGGIGEGHQEGHLTAVSDCVWEGDCEERGHAAFLCAGRASLNRDRTPGGCSFLRS